MDFQLQEILESLMRNIDVLNIELERFLRSDQFAPSRQSFQLIESIRGSCTTTLQHLQAIERAMHRNHW
jgi:hypothetical protein